MLKTSYSLKSLNEQRMRPDLLDACQRIKTMTTWQWPTIRKGQHLTETHHREWEWRSWLVTNHCKVVIHNFQIRREWVTLALFSTTLHQPLFFFVFCNCSRVHRCHLLRRDNKTTLRITYSIVQRSTHTSEQDPRKCELLLGSIGTASLQLDRLTGHLADGNRAEGRQQSPASRCRHIQLFAKQQGIPRYCFHERASNHVWACDPSKQQNNSDLKE